MGETSNVIKVYDTGMWAHINVKLLHYNFTMIFLINITASMDCGILFNRAADQGNIEALIKLGVAYLYNEGCK